MIIRMTNIPFTIISFLSSVGPFWTKFVIEKQLFQYIRLIVFKLALPFELSKHKQYN